MRADYFWYLSLLTMATSVLGLPYSVRQINQNGIFFEPIGKVKYYHNSWEIITYVKLLQPDVLEKHLNSSETAVTTVCQGYHEKLELHLADTCLHTKQQIHALNARIRDLFAHVDTSGTRSRRGLINAGGKLAKFLFGTMDDEDSDSIFGRLQTLEKNHQKQMDLMQEQTSVIKSNFEASRKPLEDVRKDLTEITNFVTQQQENANKNFREVTENEKSLWTRVAFNEFASSIIRQTQEIERQLTITASIMSAINNRKLHPLILSFHQVNEYIRNLSLSAEVDRSIGAFALEQLANVQGAIYKDALLVKITVPIVEPTTFNLERLHYLPIYLGKQVTALLNLHEEYLALDDGETKFIPMQRGDLITYCQDVLLNITNRVKICKLTAPIVTSEKGDCLLLLRRSWSEAKDFCSLTYTNFSGDVLVKLQNPNSWIFTFQTERELQVDCPNFHTIMRLNNNGIFSLQPHCQATVGIYQLRAENTVTVELPALQPDRLVPWHLPTNFSTPDIPSTSPLNATLHISDSRTHDSLLHAQRGKILKLEEHLDKAQQEDQVKRTHTQSMTATVLSGCVCITFIMFLLVTLWRHISRRTRPRGDNAPHPPKPNLSFPVRQREEISSPQFEVGPISADVLPPPPHEMLGQLPIKI